MNSESQADTQPQLRRQAQRAAPRKSSVFSVPMLDNRNYLLCSANKHRRSSAMKTYTYRGKCKQCGDEFIHVKTQPHGAPRKFCYRCRPAKKAEPKFTITEE